MSDFDYSMEAYYYDEEDEERYYADQRAYFESLGCSFLLSASKSGPEEYCGRAASFCPHDQYYCAWHQKECDQCVEDFWSTHEKV